MSDYTLRLLRKGIVLAVLCCVAVGISRADLSILYCSADYGDASNSCASQLSACNSSPNVLIPGYCQNQNTQCMAVASNNFYSCANEVVDLGGPGPNMECPDENYCDGIYNSCIVSNGDPSVCNSAYGYCESCHY